MMGTIASLTMTANQIQKLLDLKVEPLNEKLKAIESKIIFRYVNRGNGREMLPFLSHGIWRMEITLGDDDMPKLMNMNADEIVAYLKYDSNGEQRPIKMD